MNSLLKSAGKWRMRRVNLVLRLWVWKTELRCPKRLKHPSWSIRIDFRHKRVEKKKSRQNTKEVKLNSGGCTKGEREQCCCFGDSDREHERKQLRCSRLLSLKVLDLSCYNEQETDLSAIVAFSGLSKQLRTTTSAIIWREGRHKHATNAFLTLSVFAELKLIGNEFWRISWSS